MTSPISVALVGILVLATSGCATTIQQQDGGTPGRNAPPPPSQVLDTGAAARPQSARVPYECKVLQAQPAVLQHQLSSDGTTVWAITIDAVTSARIESSGGESADEQHANGVRLRELGCVIDRTLNAASLCPDGWYYADGDVALQRDDGELVSSGACHGRL